MHVLYRCGVSRRKEEVSKVLGDAFGGIGVTDDYAAYKHMFTEHQLCWAHLIRKAIKLALQNPDEPEYATFLDELCCIYDDAKELRDANTSNATDEERTAVVKQLQARVDALCTRHQEKIIKSDSPDTAKTPAHVETYILLQRELMKNLDCLFVFVKHPAVEPTNNRSERNVRREAEIRKGARTSKTDKGAIRRSVIVTVLGSLQTRIEHFTLSRMLDEINRWITTGSSIFEHELSNLQSNRPAAV